MPFVATTTKSIPPACGRRRCGSARETSILTQAHGFYWTEGIRGLGWAPDAVPTLKNGSTVGIASPPAILLPNGAVVTPDIRDAERLQGFEAGWTAPAEAVARPSLRWSLVGNAVTVRVARRLGGRLRTPGPYDSERDRELEVDGRWPKAARFDGERRRRVAIGSFPVWRERAPLVEFLRFEGKPLSARATRGFLSRTDRSTLRFVKGFRERLRDHLLQMEAQRGPRERELPAGSNRRRMRPPKPRDPKRSALMARVRQRGTAAELMVGATLRASKTRYRLNVRSLRGSPDFSNRKRKWAIFVHGCFWHHHTACRRNHFERE